MKRKSPKSPVIQPSPRELIILAADKDTEFALRGLLTRHPSIPMRALAEGTNYSIFNHTEHDPGCLLGSHDFLRSQATRYRHALVVFDLEGCGKSGPPESLEAEVEQRLEAAGWKDRARAIVTDPELEIWVWTRSTHVDRILGWADRLPDLRQWLTDQRFLIEGQPKPVRPKEAYLAALRKSGYRHSPSLFEELAERMSLEGCTDRAFSKLRDTLAMWFPLHGR